MSILPSASPNVAIRRVICPKCGDQMRLARVDPHATRPADVILYDCGCGATFMQTVDWPR